MRLLFLWLLLLVSAAPAAAETLEMPETPALSVTLEPVRAQRGGAYLQGQLRLLIKVASKYPFEALTLGLPEISDVQVITLAKPRTRHRKTYAGDGYVHELALALFPLKSGPLRILPVTVTGSVDKGGAEAVRFAQQSPALSVEVNPIAPRYRSDWWLVADSVAMTETWSKPPEELRAGDLVRREITVTAVGVTAERLQPLTHGRTRGIAVAEAGSDLRTELSSDGAVAQLRQAWDLRIGDDEVIYISPIGMAYWDPEARAERRVSVPAKRIEPLPRDVALLTSQVMAEARSAHERARFGLLIAAAVPAVLLLVAALVFLWTALPTRADLALRRACAASPDPIACHRAILAWSRSVHAGAGSRTVGQLKKEIGLAPGGPLDRLETALFDCRESVPNPKEIAAALLSAARRRRFSSLIHKFAKNASDTVRTSLVLTRTIPKS